MDVICERCSTAYEFDDALVSERGTTVKCTNCGHQFKVRRAQAANAPERWVVRTIDGREIEFRALRELQTAIAQSQISREDVLARGGSRPRRLGSIAELEPFFAGVTQPSAHPTSIGLGTAPRARTTAPYSYEEAPSRTEGSVAIPLPKGPREREREREREIDGLDDETHVMDQSPVAARPPTVPPPRPPRRSIPPQEAPPPPRRSSDPPPPPSVRARPPMRSRPEVHATLPVPLDDAMPPPARMPSVEIVKIPPPPPTIDPLTTPRARIDEAAASEPSPRTNATPRPPASSGTPTPGVGRPSTVHEEAYNEPRFSLPPAARREGAARWIVGLVVLGMAALAFATVGRKLLAPSSGAANPPGDERVGGLVADGEKSLLDGDLEAAQDQFAKASVLGEREPHVAADLARLAMVRSDIAWLRVRLLPDGDADLGTAKVELEQAAERARKAAALAAEIAPSDPSVARSRVDALRFSADLDGARKLISGIAAASSEPDNALVLAELDLAEAKPEWPTVLGRLRTALTGDHNLGRARGMLVYALARSGDGAAAKAELERLSALPRPHPLLRALRAYVNRAEGAPSADTSAKAPPAKSATVAAAVPVPVPGTGPAPGPGVGATPRPPPIDNGGATPRPPPVAGPIDTSDLPGVKAPPVAKDPPGPKAPPTPPPTAAAPPGVDTSDLPGFK